MTPWAVPVLHVTDNIDFDRAYMVDQLRFRRFQPWAVSPPAELMVTLFMLTTETEGDRVRFDTTMDKWMCLPVIYEKR